MSDNRITTLNTALDEEAIALRRGNYDDLPVLREKIFGLVEQLASKPPEPSVLRPIKAKIEANQRLIEAAISGVAAARERIAQLHEVRDGLSVYNARGIRATTRLGKGGMERKA